jgi:hypothetical protein
VSSGKPVRGVDVEIADENRERLSEGRVGRVLVRGPSITSDGVDAEGFLDTGTAGSSETYLRRTRDLRSCAAAITLPRNRRSGRGCLGVERGPSPVSFLAARLVYAFCAERGRSPRDGRAIDGSGAMVSAVASTSGGVSRPGASLGRRAGNPAARRAFAWADSEIMNHVADHVLFPRDVPLRSASKSGKGAGFQQARSSSASLGADPRRCCSVFAWSSKNSTEGFRSRHLACREFASGETTPVVTSGVEANALSGTTAFDRSAISRSLSPARASSRPSPWSRASWGTWEQGSSGFRSRRGT